MSKILITGGAGFIGSNLAEQLFKNGWKVVLLDIKRDSKNIHENRNKIEYIYKDIRDVDLFNVLNEIKPDGIVHLAAKSRVVWCEKDQEECVSINVSGIKNMLSSIELMEDKPWLIFTSSREVYGNPKRFPVEESFPRNPISKYAETKCDGEDLIRKFANANNEFNAIILRLSNVYGNEKDISDRVIPKFIIRAIEGKEIVIYGRDKFFDFTFIDDAISAIVKAIDRINNVKLGEVEIYNVCTGKPTTLEELVDIISDITSSKVKVVYKQSRAFEVKNYYGDCSKAKNYLGYEPKWSIYDGIKYAVKRYQQRYFGVNV